MAKKKEVSKEILELKKDLTEEKIIFGRKEVLGELEEGRLGKVYLAGNCPKEIKEEVEHYASLMKVQVVGLELSNEEIGVLAKKHFFISVLGVRKK